VLGTRQQNKNIAYCVELRLCVVRFYFALVILGGQKGRIMNKPFYKRYFEADQGTPSGSPAEPATDTKPDEQPFKVFDSQSEFDSFIDQRLDKAREKWSTDNKSAVDDAVAEALRQAQLSEEEKTNEAAAQRDAELAELREKVALNERRSSALTKLSEANLDASLIDVLNLSSDDAMATGIEALGKFIPAQIQAGVEAKLASQTTPPAKATANNVANSTAEALGLKTL